MTPLFTTGKLKLMYPIMNECGKILTTYIQEQIKLGNDVQDVKNLSARFTVTNISSIAFGTENDCINEKENVFFTMGTKMFRDPSLRQSMANVMAILLPELMLKLKIKFADDDTEDFFRTVVRETIEHREKNNIQRNDFMQLMIQMKEQGYQTSDRTVNDDKNVSKLSFNEIMAQAFIFFVAGYETSSGTMSFCLFELAKNQEVLKKVQDEIDSVLSAANSSEITYDLLNEMKYLDYCIDETLRKYPIVPMLFRRATSDYKIPDTNLVLEKGTSVFIPLLGIQRDPEIYENPLEFKPERFENSSTGNGNAKGLFYLPFGEGNRYCIGARLGKLQTKLGLVTILQNFNIELNNKEFGKKELDFNVYQIPLICRDNIDLKISVRER
jgi:cytochrome P450 family 6